MDGVVGLSRYPPRDPERRFNAPGRLGRAGAVLAKVGQKQRVLGDALHGKDEVVGQLQAVLLLRAPVL